MQNDGVLQMDDKEIRMLELAMKRWPLKFHRATAGLLNDFAFGTRTDSIKVINRRLTVRSPRFIASTIRVTKARGNKPLDQQKSIVGSITKPRFSGLAEQELGERTDRTRVATLIARGGSKEKRIKPSVRLKAGNQFLSYHDFPGQSAEHRTTAMLQKLFREKYRRPFLITKHPRFKRGLYRIRRGRLRMVQSFEPRRVQPKRVRWLTTGQHYYFSHTNIRERFGGHIERQFGKKR